MNWRMIVMALCGGGLGAMLADHYGVWSVLAPPAVLTMTYWFGIEEGIAAVRKRASL